MFYDYAKVHVQAGDGGNGLVAFRREKYVPLGLRAATAATAARLS